MLGLRKQIKEKKDQEKTESSVEKDRTQENGKPEEGKQKNVFSLKAKKGTGRKPKINAAELRVQKGMRNANVVSHFYLQNYNLSQGSMTHLFSRCLRVGHRSDSWCRGRIPGS